MVDTRNFLIGRVLIGSCKGNIDSLSSKAFIAQVAGDAIISQVTRELHQGNHEAMLYAEGNFQHNQSLVAYPIPTFAWLGPCRTQDSGKPPTGSNDWPMTVEAFLFEISRFARVTFTDTGICPVSLLVDGCFPSRG